MRIHHNLPNGLCHSNIHVCGHQRNQPCRIWMKLPTFAHLKQCDSHPNVSSCKILPIHEPFEECWFETSYHGSIETYLAEFCSLHLPLIHTIVRHMILHKLKVILPIVLHTIINHAKKNMCNPSSLNFLQDTTCNKP
jgi:hypothetical protein